VITTVDVQDTDEVETITALRTLASQDRSAFEAQQLALQMANDGYTTEQIGTALGYSADVIANFTQNVVTIGSSEEVMQEGLKRIVSLIPIAEAQYRERPSTSNAYAVTNFMESARSIVEQLCDMKDKEAIYQNVLTKILRPFCRDMVKAMMSEISELNKSINPDEVDLLSKLSINMGKKFQECYRKSIEDLATELGVSAERMVSEKTDGG